jgi:hypothetical protein
MALGLAYVLEFIVKRVPFVLLLFVAASSITACSLKGQTIDPNLADRAAERASPKLPLPPSITKSYVYRCRDDSVVYVDFLSDGLSADLRTADNGPIIRLQAPAPDKSFAGGGYALAGHNAAIKFTKPGGRAEPCAA